MTLKLLVAIPLLLGCTTYEPRPLNLESALREIERQHESNGALTGPELTFVGAAELMSANSIVLDSIRADYVGARKVADISTPWINPTLILGQDLGTNLAPGSVGKQRPFIGLGFTIPLGSRLSENDNLNKALALEAWIDAQIRHRELYLDLRESFTRFVLSSRRNRLQKEVVAAMGSMRSISDHLLETGIIDALEAGMIELEESRSRLTALSIENQLETARARLAALTGLNPRDIPDPDLTTLRTDTGTPEFETLKATLLTDNFKLARLRQQYETAEIRLKLEISKQYPDLNIGADREKAVGGSTVVHGLRLGIELPVFDRNQLEIAKAREQREAVRKRYMAELQSALSRLHGTHRSAQNVRARIHLIRSVISPRAEANLQTARRALEHGALDPVKYLDVLRTDLKTRTELADLELEALRTGFALDRIVGKPLIRFTGEPAFDIPLSSTRENSND